MNAQLRDNMLQTAPALVTTDGDLVVATAANTLKRLAAFSGDVLLMELGAWELDISLLTTNDTVGGASSGVAEIKVPVTQVEAEAGTNTRFSLWSSQRVKQAIAALSGSTRADQAAAEAETDEATYMSPDLVLHSPGVAKIWIKWETVGAHSIQIDHNMTSITDGGAAGDTDHTFAVTFSSGNYAVVFGALDDHFIGLVSASIGDAAISTITVLHDGVAADTEHNSMAIYGDL